MRVKVIIRHYRDGERLQAGEVLDMPDDEAQDLILLGYVERVRGTPGRPPKVPPHTDFAGQGTDRMIKTKGR